MKVYIPFKPDDPKTRLSDVLDRQEREEFVMASLRDVYDSVEGAGHSPVVYSTRQLSLDAQTRICPEPLTPAVNRLIESVEPPFGVVMADLALVTPDAVARLIDTATETDADLTLAPGRGGGTNAFVLQSSNFEVDYHGTSYLDHLEIARERGLEVEEVDSFRLSTDIDEVEDLPEVLMHGEGRAHNYLKERFEIVVSEEENRVKVERK